MTSYIAHYGVGHLQGGNSGRYKYGTGEKWAKKASSSKERENKYTAQYYQGVNASGKFTGYSGGGGSVKLRKQGDTTSRISLTDRSKNTTRDMSEDQEREVRANAEDMADGLKGMINATQSMRSKGNGYLNKLNNATGFDILNSLTKGDAKDRIGIDQDDLNNIASSAKKVSDSYEKLYNILKKDNTYMNKSATYDYDGELTGTYDAGSRVENESVNGGLLKNENPIKTVNGKTVTSNPDSSFASGMRNSINAVNRDTKKYWDNISKALDDNVVVQLLNEASIGLTKSDNYVETGYAINNYMTNASTNTMTSSEFDQMLQGALDIANGMKVMEHLKENYTK